MNLLQIDGFNPLVVKGDTFTLQDKDGFIAALGGRIDSPVLDKIMAIVSGKFTPGMLIMSLEKNAIRLPFSADELLNLLMPMCVKNTVADFAEGYWTDHWHYNIDLLESYLSLYPENLRELIFEKKTFCSGTAMWLCAHAQKNIFCLTVPLANYTRCITILRKRK